MSLVNLSGQFEKLHTKELAVNKLNEVEIQKQRGDEIEKLIPIEVKRQKGYEITETVEEDEVVPCLVDNKIMTADQLPSPHHTIRLNPIDCEKSKPDSGAVNCRKYWIRRMRCTIFVDILTTIIVLTILLGVELGLLPHRKLGFRCKDPTISFPYTGDTISLVNLLLGSYFGPMVLFTFIEVVREKSFKNVRIGIIWEYYKEILIGASFVLLLTEIAKALVGEHRPHFFDVCRPDMNEECIEGTFIENYSCTNKAFNSWLVKDATKSFPSGHSSLSVFCSLFCAYVVQTRLPSAATGRLFKCFLVAICLSWGILCSLSRIADRRHHWWDVLCGIVLGTLGMIFITAVFHQKQKRKLHRASEKSISSTMLLDVKSKVSSSARV